MRPTGGGHEPLVQFNVNCLMTSERLGTRAGDLLLKYKAAPESDGAAQGGSSITPVRILKSS